MLEGIKAVFFDLDNTLINRNAAHMDCIEQFFTENLPDYYFDNEEFEIGQNDNWGYTPRIEFSEWFLQKYEPQGWDEDSFWEYIHGNIHQFINPVEDILLQFLDSLRSNYKTGIITNGSIYNQSNKIQKANLKEVFTKENIYISEQYKISKPDKTFFELVLKEQQIQPNELLFIGDDPINDILGAAQLGINTCWLNYNREWNKELEPNHSFKHLKRVIQYLDSSY